MGNAKRDAEDEESRARASGESREPDLSVPDLEIEPGEHGGPDHRAGGDSPGRRGFSGGQWILLWLVVTLGVASGRLVSNFITSVAVAYQVRAVLPDVAEGAGEASGEAQETAERREGDARARRKESERGRSLARQCNDWQAAHEELNTRTTRRNRDKYCNAYREFIRTGRVSFE